MKISIITATFNNFATVQGTIDSVVSQGTGDWEYIVVDNCSTDGTLELVDNMACRDPRIRYVSEPHEGIADAFNKGLRLATGDWFGFIGADDRYLPDALEAITNAVREHPEVDVIHGDMVRLDEEGVPLFVVSPSDVEKTVWHQMPINHPASFVSRKILNQVGAFDKTLKIAMDYDLVLRIFKAGGRFVYINHTIMQMSYGGASDSRFLAGLQELRRIKVREGYPRYKANYWLGYRWLVETTKKILRRFGLHALLRLHPRFRGVDQPGP